MLKTQRAAHAVLTFLFDIIAIVLAYVAAWFLRDSLGALIGTVAHALHLPVRQWVRTPDEMPLFYQILFSNNPLVDFRNYTWVLFLSLPCWLLCLYMRGGYSPISRNKSRQFSLCVSAGILGMAIFVISLFLAKLNGVSRLLLVNYLVFGILLLWFSRAYLLPLITRHSQHNGFNLLVIGNAISAARLQTLVDNEGINLLGYVGDPPASKSTFPQRNLRHLGTINQLGEILDNEVVDEVVLMQNQGVGALDNLDGKAQNLWRNVLEISLQRGRSVSMFSDVIAPVGTTVETQLMGNIPMVVLHNTPQNPVTLAIKRIIDFVTALIMLILLSPVLLILAILIKKHDGGPVLFVQDRVGRNGRIFKFYKFRSMVLNAAETLEKMKREEPERYRAINIMEEPFFKAKEGDDPRITPIGRIIRKYSLDELPQFWNVLRGDMSLVGPRPPLPKEVAELEPWQRRKLSVKGGLTCIWQASGRNDITDTDDWMRMDLEYIDNFSLWLDFKLLFKTIFVLIRPKGAS